MVLSKKKSSRSHKTLLIVVGLAVLVLVALGALGLVFRDQIASFVAFRGAVNPPISNAPVINAPQNVTNVTKKQPLLIAGDPDANAQCVYSVNKPDQVLVLRYLGPNVTRIIVRIPNVFLNATTAFTRVGEDALIYQPSIGSGRASNYVSDYDCVTKKLNRVTGQPRVVPGLSDGAVGSVMASDASGQGYALVRNQTNKGLGKSDHICTFDSVSNAWNLGLPQQQCPQLVGKDGDSISNLKVEGPKAVILHQDAKGKPYLLSTYNFRPEHAAQPWNEFWSKEKYPSPYRPDGGFDTLPWFFEDQAHWYETNIKDYDFIINFGCDPTLPRDDDPKYYPDRCVVYKVKLPPNR